MARWAMVHDDTGYVVNMVEWDGNVKTWKPPAGYTMVEDKEVYAGPGFRYEDGQFIPPPSGEVE
jgi:hypothetical protein